MADKISLCGTEIIENEDRLRQDMHNANYILVIQFSTIKDLNNSKWLMLFHKIPAKNTVISAVNFLSQAARYHTAHL